MPSRRRRRRGGRKSARKRQDRSSPAGVRAFAVRFLRRRSTRWLFAAIITLTIGIVLGVIGGGGGDDGSNPPPTPTLAVDLPDLQPPDGLQPATVLEVIDGDTIDVRMGGREERVRYYGVDTPERGERCFAEATGRNEALAGGRVLLLPDAQERDDFGRLLRYVFTEEGVSLEARLIAEGLGVAWREDGAYRDELVALEAEVRAASAGCLWGEGG